jgi:RNA polymerase sigma-70 factor (ECF subfamily)
VNAARQAQTDLVAAAQQGDKKAMNSLLESEYDRIYAVCRRIMGNDADADDGCQQALIAVVRGISRFDNRSKFSTWTYRVATNACLDEIRRRQRRPLPSDDVADTPVSTQSHDSQTTDRMVLSDALDGLAADFRLPLVLRDIVGCDYNEIAVLLDIPPGTVRSRIARGRRHLSDALGNQTETDSVIEPKRRSNKARPPAQ